jgi:glycolate oxidase
VVPAALELMDRAAVRAVELHVRAGLPVDAGAVLLVEVEGAEEEVEDDAATVLRSFTEHAATDRRTARDAQERALLWAGRKQVVGALGRICKGYYTHDGVVPPSRLAEALARIESIAARHDLDVATVAHAGDGNLHPLLLFRTLCPDELARGAKAGREILETCIELGGSLTGEHGVGCEKRDLIHAEFDDATRALFDRVRVAFDPQRRMNPGKVLPEGAICGDAGLPHGAKRAAGWL